MERFIGKVVRVDFLDHTQGDGNVAVIRCRLFGLICEVDATSILVKCWTIPDDVDPANEDGYRILRSTILDIEVLTEDKRTPCLTIHTNTQSS